MTATVRLFAGAAEAVGTAQVSSAATNVTQLVADLDELGGPGTAQVLARCAVIVNGVRSEDGEVPIPDSALVDVLPPFAGG